MDLRQPQLRQRLNHPIDIDYNSKLIAPISYTENKIEVDRNIPQEQAWKLVDETMEIVKKDFNLD